MKIVVALTSGWEIETGKPYASGCLRLEKLVQLLQEKKKIDGVAIIGGWPDSMGLSEAQRYFNCLPESIRESVTIIDGLGNNTVDDIISLVGSLRKKYGNSSSIELQLITSPYHFRRIWRTVVKLKCSAKMIESGEVRTLNPILNIILTFLNMVDPLWRSPGGRLMRTIANKRARNYYLRSRDKK